MRDRERIYSAPLIRHWSYVLTADGVTPGRCGITICGLPGAADQERALYLARERNIYANVKIHEMRPCLRCLNFVRSLST
jgi:hypothetical protein